MNINHKNLGVTSWRNLMADNTLLIEATASGNMALVKFLIERGADINAVNRSNKNAVQAAMEPILLSGQKAKDFYPIVQYFLREKPDEAKDLFVKAFQNNPNLNIIKCLSNEEVNLQTSEGKTPLMYAIKSENKQLIQQLLKLDADIKLTDNNGQTALDYAIQTHNMDIIGSILDQHLSDLEGSFYKLTAQVLNQDVQKHIRQAFFSLASNRFINQHQTKSALNHSIIGPIVLRTLTDFEDGRDSLLTQIVTKNNYCMLKCILDQDIVKIKSDLLTAQISSHGTLLDTIFHVAGNNQSVLSNLLEAITKSNYFGSLSNQNQESFESVVNQKINLLPASSHQIKA